MIRKSLVERITSETTVKCQLHLNDDRISEISTGIGFFDHLLSLMCFHGGFYMKLEVKGDLHIDDHHTVEDIGLVMGKAFNQALGKKVGINRYGCELIAMDEALSRSVIDLCNRSFLVYKVEFTREAIGDLALENIKEWFKSFVNESKMTLHIENIYGENNHHIAEGIFKALGRSLSEAVRINSNRLESTKGVLI